MTKDEKIFNKHNPKGDIVRCPSGRSAVRKLLSCYVKAAINLYGIISKKELVEIFNSQNSEKTDVDELYILMLPLVIENRWFCFYGDYIVHCSAIDNFALADYWLGEQEGKPRFIPEKQEFLRYENHYDVYVNSAEYWMNLREYTLELWWNRNEALKLQKHILECSSNGADVHEVMSILERCGLEFETNKQMEKFFQLYIDACNNSRLIVNKGHTPNELADLHFKETNN